jgi:hypothetical protein
MGIASLHLSYALQPALHNFTNKSDNKLSPIVDPQVLHFMQVPLAARKSQ